MASRPELQAPPEIFYNDDEARKYTSSSRIIDIQAKLSERALELLALPDDGVPRLLLDIGAKKVENSTNWGALVAGVPNRTLWHMYEGMEEILADYVHQETTRTWMLVCFRLFLIITIKDAFLALAHL